MPTYDKSKEREQKALALSRLLVALERLTDAELAALPEQFQIHAMTWLVIRLAYAQDDPAKLERALAILQMDVH
jgi:hypothetical protein